MGIIVSTVTDAEYELVREHFNVKALALADKPIFWVDEDGNAIFKKGKGWFKANYDKSKYLKAVIDGEAFIIAAGNVIAEMVKDVLPEACQKHPTSFGNKNAHTVVSALYDTHPVPEYAGDINAFEDFLSTEQFAMVFKLLPDGSVDKMVLRLDLFRLIQENKDAPGTDEFTGGLMHALKHFNFDGYPLSTGKGENSLCHPSDIISMVIKGFFQSDHIRSADRKGIKTVTQGSNNKTMTCSFFEEPIIDLYFLNTLYLK